MFSYLDKEVILCGDGRCDSPGSSAKYCTYTLMESSTGTILGVIIIVYVCTYTAPIDFQTVDKREVNFKSPNMEREGLKRSISYLKSQDIILKEITTHQLYHS